MELVRQILKTKHMATWMKQAGWICILLLISLGAQAQREGDDDEKREDRIERLKRVYITEKLDLTVAEAEKFWPIYNEYSKKRKDVRRKIRLAHQSTESSGMTEKAMRDLNAQITTFRHEEVDLDSAFMLDVLQVLGPEKAARLVKLEQEFRRELMERMQERRDDRRSDGPPRR